MVFAACTAGLIDVDLLTDMTGMIASLCDITAADGGTRWPLPLPDAPVKRTRTRRTPTNPAWWSGKTSPEASAKAGNLSPYRSARPEPLTLRIPLYRAAGELLQLGTTLRAEQPLDPVEGPPIAVKMSLAARRTPLGAALPRGAKIDNRSLTEVGQQTRVDAEWNRIRHRGQLGDVDRDPPLGCFSEQVPKARQRVGQRGCSIR